MSDAEPAPFDRPEAVLFDLDDTLCAYRRPGSDLLATAFDAVGVDPFFDVEEYYGRYAEFAAQAEGVAAVRERCFATLAAERGRDPDVGRAVAAAYAAERDHANVRPLPGVPEALRRFAADGHRVGLVTNGPPDIQRTKLDALGLTGAFETAVFAGHGTAPKPDPEPFRAALDALGVAPGSAVHVGNAPETDVAGAASAGLRTVLVEGDTDPATGAEGDAAVVPDLRVGSVADLLPPPWE
ncbi:MAG: HAD family hydrolase [Haloferacaceae archaeon]